MSAALGPYGWHLHLFTLLVLAAIVVGYVVTTRRPGCAPSPRQRTLFACGVVLLAVAVAWPVADLAAHWLLLALVVQRLLLTLAVPPLLVMGTPRPVLARLTRPGAVDAVLRLAVRPFPAVVIVTVVAVATLTTGVVSLTARSDFARVCIEMIVLASGFVLWAPVLSELPGEHRLTPLARGGYLIVQSIVPSFLSIVWIFARHALYPPYSHHGTVAGLSPLLDQQLSGFVAKLGTIAVLWTVAFVIMTRAEAAEISGDDEPLLWSDVQREIERANRRQRRNGWPGPTPTP